jgi:hypothetical protein
MPSTMHISEVFPTLSLTGQQVTKQTLTGSTWASGQK